MDFPEIKSSPIPRARFTGIFIPVEILEMKELSPLEMMLLSWIDALQCKEKGGCFASNKYLAEKLNLKDKSVSEMITKLKKLNLIRQLSFDGRERILITYTWFRFFPEADSGYGGSLPTAKTVYPLPPKPQSLILYSKEENKDVVVVSRERARVDCGDVYNPPPPASLTKDDVYHACIAERRDWLPHEIEYAWSVYPKSDKIISDPFQYIDGIIKKQRILAKNRKNSCQNKSNPKKELKKSQEIVKRPTSETNSEELVYLGSVLNLPKPIRSPIS